MSLTASNMIPLGTFAPSFTLSDSVTGKIMSLSSLQGVNSTVVMFICNHCPYVKHINAELVKIANYYSAQGVQFIAISSNDSTENQEDSPAQMKVVANNLGYPFPYLYDELQAVAKAYDAACTPDFYVFNKELKLVYRGQLDDARPSNKIPVSGSDIRAALDAVINNQEVSHFQRPSIGCNIKWKKN